MMMMMMMTMTMTMTMTMAMMMMMTMTDVRPCCKGLLSKYEPISDASQVPVDSSLMINFPILVIKQNLNINILKDFLSRTLSFSPIS